MNRWWIRFLVAAAVLLLVLAAGALALYRWVGQADFRERVSREASAALGVPVQLGAIRVDWFPAPAVALDDVVVQTQPPITARAIEARPVWRALLQGRPEVATLVVRKAQLPQQGIDALVTAVQKRRSAAPHAAPHATPNAAPAASPSPVDAGAAAAALWLPQRTVIDGLTWISAKGVATTLDAQAQMDDGGLPREVRLKVTAGPYAGTSARIEAAGAAQARAGEGAAASASPAPTRSLPGARDWNIDVAIGGGHVRGRATLAPPAAPGREMALSGELKTQDVEVMALTAPGRPLSGKLDATTSFQARAASPAALVDAMRTQSRFVVKNAVLNGLDLVKAVSRVGSRGGETSLSELSGHVATQGRAAQLTNLVARSGVLAAQGDVAISAQQALSGRLVVDVTAGAAAGLTGIPLTVGGTVAAPEVALSRSAMLGAALGTAVMPGVGTGAGAKLGDTLGRGLSGLFGGKK